MSKGVRPTSNPQPPVAGTKGYLRVVKRGCGGYRDSYSGEYDCRLYEWTCDDCPVCIESQLAKELEWFRGIHALQGPPRNRKHPSEYWLSPSVETELVWWYGDESDYSRMVKVAMELQPKEVPLGRTLILGN